MTFQSDIKFGLEPLLLAPARLFGTKENGVRDSFRYDPPADAPYEVARRLANSVLMESRVMDVECGTDLPHDHGHLRSPNHRDPTEFALISSYSLRQRYLIIENHWQFTSEL